MSQQVQRSDRGLAWGKKQEKKEKKTQDSLSDFSVLDVIVHEAQKYTEKVCFYDGAGSKCDRPDLHSPFSCCAHHSDGPGRIYRPINQSLHTIRR